MSWYRDTLPPARAGVRPESAAPGSNVQLKESLRGRSYPEQRALLAPVQLKRSYASMAPEFRGNNNVKVLERSGYHLSIVDPSRTTDFEEFHVTFEKNVDGRRPHFYFDDAGKYQPGYEDTEQNEAYRDDADDQSKNLPSFGELSTVSSFAARGFLNELNEADARVAAEKLAAEEEAAARKAAQQGCTGLELISRWNIKEGEGNVWGAKPKWTKQGGEAVRDRVMTGMPDDALNRISPLEGGEKFKIVIKLSNLAAQGAAAMRNAKADPDIATATFKNVG